MARLTAGAVAEALAAAANIHGGQRAIGALARGAGYSPGTKEYLSFRRSIERSITGGKGGLQDRNTAALLRGMAGAGVTTTDARLLRAADGHAVIPVKLTLDIKRFPQDQYERRAMTISTPLRAILRSGYGPGALASLDVPPDYLALYEGEPAEYEAAWDGVTHSGEFGEDTIRDAEELD